MKGSRIFGILIIIFQIGSFLVFCVSGYTIFQVLISSMPVNVAEPIVTDKRDDISELTLILNPRNSGYLPVSLTLELNALINKEQVASNYTSLVLKPNNNKRIVLTLVISSSEFEYIFQENDGALEVFLDIRTLGNTVGFSLNTQIRGGKNNE